MRIRFLGASLLLAGMLASAPSANATTISVTNSSFETLPSAGLPNGCGLACSYSIDAIPGWTNSGDSGQFQPGSAGGNTTYFNYVPDGLTVAYTNGGSISQTVAALAQAGTTYTLSADIGFRNDGYGIVGNDVVELLIGSNAIFATGTPPSDGTWSTYFASYTATSADAGQAITIILQANGPQGDFDNVSLASRVPEPMTLALFGAGLAGAVAMRRRKKKAA